MKVQEVIEQHAQAIVDEVLAEREMVLSDFLTRKTIRYVTARVTAMRRLQKAGHSIAQIGRTIGMQPKSVKYHLSADVRTKNNADRSQRYAASRLRVLSEARS